MKKKTCSMITDVVEHLYFEKILWLPFEKLPWNLQITQLYMGSKNETEQIEKLYRSRTKLLAEIHIDVNRF